MQRLEVLHAQPLNQHIIMCYVMEPLEKEEIREYCAKQAFPVMILTTASASYNNHCVPKLRAYITAS